MQSRRWWYSVALTLTLTALATPALAAPPTPVTLADVPREVTKLAGARNAEDARKTADDILAGLAATSSSIPSFDKFATTIVNEVNGQILKPEAAKAGSMPPHVLVTGASLLVESQTRVNTAGIPPRFPHLADRLPHPSPVVRYWAAKGMVTILSGMSASNKAAAVKGWGPALKTAADKETSAPARAQELRALGLLGLAKDINDPLAKVVAVFRTKTPTSADAAAIAADLDSLAEGVRNGTPTPADLTAAVTNAANAASFLAQHAAKIELAASDGASAKLKLEAKQLHAAATDAVNAAIRVVSAAVKSAAPAPLKFDTAAVMQITIDEWTNPRNTTSAIQKHFPTVPYPARIGEVPVTAPAATTKAPATAKKPK